MKYLLILFIDPIQIVAIDDHGIFIIYNAHLNNDKCKLFYFSQIFCIRNRYLRQLKNYHQ
jgi:hypothetical protein